MKSKAIFVALLALAFAARAARVSQSEAAGAASVWAARGGAFGIKFGRSVESSATHTTTNGAVFYSVKMRGGGTVFMSSDTEMNPVIAFTASSGDFSSMDAKSPLWALLNRDVSARKSFLSGTPQVQQARYATSASASLRWAALLSGSDGGSGVKRALSAAPRTSEPSDLRVAPLMLSEWDQADAGGGYHISDARSCYNYYTPQDATGEIKEGKKENAVCGCVATAMGQVMFYHRYPETATVPDEPDTCWFDTKEITLPVSGEAYAWDDMVAVPDAFSPVETRAAIGLLVSDAGRSVGMHYSRDDSGSFSFKASKALVSVFNYGQSVYADAGDVGPLSSGSSFERVVLSNLDAGYPVIFGIRGASGGHEIVADGYGYDDEAPYVHLNMGWSGSQNIWYNLPEITAGSMSFDTVDDAVYNIIPDGAGKGILSGRTLDDDGEPVANAEVTVYDAETGEVAAQIVTSASGVWGVALPAGTYELVAYDSEKLRFAESDPITLEAPVQSDKSISWYAPVGTETGLYPAVTSALNVGNSWGNDMVLEFPSVRVGDEVFSSVDRGIAKARELAETAAEPPVIEILYATRLKKTQTIDFSCVLFATNATPAASPVARPYDAQLVVASGATLVMSNIVFAAGSGTVVDVADGGLVGLSGIVDFGVDYETAAVSTATATGFRLLGGLLSGFVLKCEEAEKAGDVFGYVTTDNTATFKAIRDSAARIANYYDPIGELRGHLQGDPPNYTLVWSKQPVPVEDSVGYYIDAEGATNTAARIDRLFDLYADALANGDLGDVRRIVLRKGGSLSRPLTVADGLSLVGDDVAVSLEPTAGFIVTGGELAISGIAFSGYKGNAFFLVNGEDAALSLGTGTALSDFEGTNKWSGAVTVLKGSASASGAVFTNCQATGQYSLTKRCNSYGGAFYIAPQCSLALENCTIANCWARNYGGAVYAATNATVTLAGELHIAGSTQGTSAKVDSDIFLCYASKGGSRATLRVEEAISGEAGVRWQNSGVTADDFGNTNGLLAAAAASAAVAHGSSGVLFSNANTPALVAVPDDDAVALRWTESPTGPQPWEGDPDDASARVEYADGTEVYYLLVSEALEAVDGDATIWVQGWDGLSITGTVTIAHNITIASDTDVGAYWLDRRADSSIVVGEGASLTLRDITLFGCTVTVTSAGDMVLSGDPTTKPLIDVQGGSLTLATPSEGFDTEIACVFGDEARNAGAVCVWKGGSFRMESGAAIRDCYNDYANVADRAGRGGALLVDDGTAVFAGGTIEFCEAYTGGGVFIGNKGAVSISGDTIIDGNSDLYYAPSDLVVYDQGTLTLAGKFTGSIGYIEGSAGDTEVFGEVDAGVSAADALASAHNFYHDRTGDVGMAVAGEGRTILVWSGALADDGTYTDEDGEVYTLVDGDAYDVPVPAAAGLVYNGEEQFGVEDGVGYTATDNSAVAAGEYTATLTLRPGFEWEDGSTGAKSVDWSIAKATYDMSGVTFDDKTFFYDAKYHAIGIEGDLPDGVTVSYVNERQRDIGEYVVTASFAGDYANYEEIPDMTATLKILAPEEPTPPGDDPQSPAQPKPIAFTAVVKGDGSWTVSLTTAVEKCWYSLYETNSISGGFSPSAGDTSFIQRRQATAADVPTMTFTISADEAQRFWRVVAEPEDAH